MKGKLASIRPELCEYGPATPAIRRILQEWMDIDWFTPPQKPRAQERAIQLFLEHNARARSFMPSLFAAQPRIQVPRGDLSDFSVWVARVKAQSSNWDWKYAVLKRLTSAHSQQHGWSLQAELAKLSSDRPRPGELFVSVGHTAAIWSSLAPQLPMQQLAREHSEAASWYVRCAAMDVLDCLEWQLAEKSEQLHNNPFEPLLHCYSPGLYPFCLSAGEVSLFCFDAAHRGHSTC